MKDYCYILTRITNWRDWFIWFSFISKCPFPFSCQINELFNWYLAKAKIFPLDVLIGIANLRCPKLNCVLPPTNLVHNLPQFPVAQAKMPWNHRWLFLSLILHHIGMQILWSLPTKYSLHLLSTPTATIPVQAIIFSCLYYNCLLGVFPVLTFPFWPVTYIATRVILLKKRMSDHVPSPFQTF